MLASFTDSSRIFLSHLHVRFKKEEKKKKKRETERGERKKMGGGGVQMNMHYSLSPRSSWREVRHARFLPISVKNELIVCRRR